MRYHLTLKSGNGKVGKIPVSTSTNATCPDACPLKAKGCYANGGPLAIHWRKVSNGLTGMLWHEFVSAIAALPIGQIWRHNQAGDLPGDNNHIDAGMLAELVSANRGKHGFTYTHKPMSLGNRLAIQHANANGFTVNLSANNLEHADQLADLGIAPVCTLLPSDAPDKGKTPNGKRWIACPAERSETLTCADCQLCAKQRSIIVGFHAHGNGAKAANAIAKGAI